MKNEQKKLYSRTAEIGCILCRHLGYGETPAELHHIRKYGSKRDNAPVIPLCPEHHRGNTGVHGLGKKGFERYYGLSEYDLLDKTKEVLDELL